MARVHAAPQGTHFDLILISTHPFSELPEAAEPDSGWRAPAHAGRLAPLLPKARGNDCVWGAGGVRLQVLYVLMRAHTHTRAHKAPSHKVSHCDSEKAPLFEAIGPVTRKQLYQSSFCQHRSWLHGWEGAGKTL